MNKFIIKYFGKKRHFIMALFFLSCLVFLSSLIILDFASSVAEFYRTINILKNY